MALKSYVVTKDFKTPYVRVTGMAKNPSATQYKLFKKGDVINGELKHVNNQPSFIMVAGTLVVPLEVVKELYAKDVTSNVTGEKEEGEKKEEVVQTNPKIKYFDAAIIGGLLGIGAVILAEKQAWIAPVEKKYKVYAVIAGALVGAYFVYRFKVNKPKAVVKNEE